jgi:hypothetical protein
MVYSHFQMDMAFNAFHIDWDLTMYKKRHSMLSLLKIKNLLQWYTVDHHHQVFVVWHDDQFEM